MIKSEYSGLVIINNDIQTGPKTLISTFSTQYQDMTRYFKTIHLYSLRKYTDNKKGTRLSDHFIFHKLWGSLSVNKFILFAMTPYIFIRVYKIFKNHKKDIIAIYYPASYIGFIATLASKFTKNQRYVRVTNNLIKEAQSRGHIGVKKIIYKILETPYKVLEKILLKRELCFFSGEQFLYPRRELSNLVEVDTLSLRKDDYYSKTFKSKELYNVYFIGRFDDNKGLKYFIQASDYLDRSKYHFNIIGFGDTFQEENIRKETANRKNLNYIGYVPFGKYLFEHLKKADFFIFPSIQEYAGKTFLEAMAFGALVIATDSGRVRKHIEHLKNGIIIDKKQSQQIADWIEYLSNNIDHALEIQKNAYEKIKDISVESMNDAIIKKVNEYYEI